MKMDEDRKHAPVSAALLLDGEWVAHNLDGQGRRTRTLSRHVCYLIRPYLKSLHTTPPKNSNKIFKATTIIKRGKNHWFYYDFLSGDMN